MKILFIITQSEIGGAQRFLLEFAPYLAKQGHEIAVVAGEGDGELFRKFDSRIKYYVSSIMCSKYRVKNLQRSLNPVKDFFALISLLKIIHKEKPDTLFLQSTKAGFLGSLAAKLYLIHNTKYIIQVVYRIGGWSFNDPRPWWMNKIIFWMEKLSAPLKDVIIINSELDRQIAIDKKIAPASKVVKIYNGIDVEKLNFLPKEEARHALVSSIKYQVSSKREAIIIGTIANLYATKGLEYLIESARQLYLMHNTRHLVQFIVIGEGKERPRLEALIKSYGLESIFFLIGRVPNAATYLKAFDIFVLPAVKEGFPWVILEAMAAQVPIIATKVGAVPEIIENGKDGLLIPSRDAPKLAQNISILIQDKDYRLSFAHNAKGKLEKFSLQKMLDESKKIV